MKRNQSRTYRAGELVVKAQYKDSGNLHIRIFGARATGKTLLRAALAERAKREGWSVNASAAPHDQGNAALPHEFLILHHPQKDWPEVCDLVNRAAARMAVGYE